MGWRSVSVGMNLAAIAIGSAALAATLALSWAIAASFGLDLGDLLTRNTVRLSFAWYAAAVCLMLFLRRRLGGRHAARADCPLVLDVGADLFSGSPGDGVSLFSSLVARPCF